MPRHAREAQGFQSLGLSKATLELRTRILYDRPTLPWNNWLLCTGSTYGTWLRGDPRGWRARRHREHVDGDYRNPPPPGAYAALEAQSRGLMKRPRVILGPSQRAAACRAMADALLFHDVELIDLCVGAAHWHVLARFTPLPKSPGIKIPGLDFAALKREARRLMGIAKKASARVLSDAGLTAPGGIWAVRCSARPIRDRTHQLALVRYVRAHARQGAAVWSQLRKQSP